jgi:arsenite-transporting ATPase
VGGVIVNMVLDRQALGPDVPEFVLNRMRMQDDHLRTIRDKFDGSVRAVVPLFDQEVRGVPMLGQTAQALFRA